MNTAWIIFWVLFFIALAWLTITEHKGDDK